MSTSLIVFFITGLIFSALSVPLIRRKVKMNSWYGIRVPQAMQSENVWYELNAIMGRYLFAFGLLTSILSLNFMLHPLEHEYQMVYFLLGIIILGTVLFVKLSFSTAAKLNKKTYNSKNN